jgi:hypothetical protein
MKAKLPDPSEPVVDPKTGKMTLNWYLFFKDLKTALGAL